MGEPEQMLMFGTAPGDPRDSWETPRDVFEQLDAVFDFRFDLAASDDNAKCTDYATRERNAFELTWARLPQPLWCNPPFSELDLWTHRAAESAQYGGAQIVMLLPANRTDMTWFHNNVLQRSSSILFSRGRIQYVAPLGVKSSSCAFGSLLALYGFGANEIENAARQLIAGWTQTLPFGDRSEM